MSDNSKNIAGATSAGVAPGSTAADAASGSPFPRQLDPAAVNAAQRGNASAAQRRDTGQAIPVKPLDDGAATQPAPEQRRRLFGGFGGERREAQPIGALPHGQTATGADGDSLPAPLNAGGFPTIRSRRTRQTDWMRRMVRQNRLSVDDLIWPIFVQEDNGATQIDGLPGVVRYGPDTVLAAVNEAQELGIPALAIFPEVAAAKKTADGAEGLNPENLTCRTVRRIKETFGDIGVIADVALDPYTNTGHDGIVEFSRTQDGEILNDETVAALVDQALIQAEAGCNIIAPSDMMDGRVGAIRRALDEAGYDNVAIMAYTAKYASAFYGPFRGAIGSQSMLKGDKKTYQMDPANSAEAIRQAQLDLAEGADLLLVKPGLPYLDILKAIKDQLAVPTYAYQVSGEYAMMAAAAENGWLDGNQIMMESLLAFKRAGADGIWTYAALDVARELGN